jgi:hypothetical protein
VATVGVNVAGYFTGVLGVGEVARGVADALEAAGVPVTRIELPRDREPLVVPWDALHPVTILCVNADAVPAARDALGPRFFEGRTTVGVWWWELEEFPERWRRSFDDVDEVWAGSRFVADALAPVSPVPVLAMPTPIRPPWRGEALDFDALGVPEGAFTVLAMHDYASVPGRKNPLGAIEAFRRAFPDGDATLIVKSVGGAEHPERHEEVLEAARRAPGVVVIDEEWPRERVDALMSSVCAFLSLHRAEGFGLNVAAAIQSAIPAVLTAWSGPMDYAAEAGAWLVPYTLVPVGPGHDPYPADARWAEPDLDVAASHLRAINAHLDAAHAKAVAAESVMARYSLSNAGAWMARRIETLTGSRPSRNGAAPLDALEQRIRAGSLPAPGTGRARLAVRNAVLRVLRPQAAHQRQVDEQILRALRDLDERLRGLAAAQESVQAELARQRRGGGPES